MTERIFTVLSREKIAFDVYKLILEGDTDAVSAPGQFVNIKLDGLFLRRPISVCDYDKDSLTLIYKVVGVGTEKMAGLSPGDKLDILVGLGNGYDMSVPFDKPLLIGGGVGVPPLYALAKRLIEFGKTPNVIIGFNSEKDVFFEQEFRELGLRVFVMTADGSYGAPGFATDAMENVEYDYFFTCGPKPMLRAVYDRSETSGQFSFEERMGCGFGACMGCSCRTKNGNKRVCKEGPVFVKEEIIW